MALVLVFVAAGVVAALSLPTLTLLLNIWDRNEFYAHAYAIPPAAAYLAYGDRRRIQAALRNLTPPAYGFVVVFVAATLQVVALIGDAGFVAGIGIPLLIGATAYAVGGMALLRPLLLPLVFLSLMVPPPGSLMEVILLDLKLFVTQTAVGLLQAAGETVGREGNVILVPGHTLFVADACSGLTSIVTMTPLACIVAYFLTTGVWRRVVVVASVIPLAVVANVFRVAVTVRMSAAWGAEVAQGSLHEGFGLATFVLGTVALIALARVLR